MAGTTLTQRNYPIADFSSGVNAAILRQEFIDDPTITFDVNTVTQSGSTVICIWDGLLTGAMEAAADAVVAAHQGQGFADPDQEETVEPPSSDSTDDWINHVLLSSGPLPQGTYRVVASSELWVSTEGAGNKAQARLRISNNQFPAGTTASEGSKTQDAPDTWACPITLSVVDGEEVQLQIQYRSQNSVTANISAARLFLNRTGDL